MDTSVVMYVMGTLSGSSGGTMSSGWREVVDTSVVMTTGMLQLLLQSIESSMRSGSELVPRVMEVGGAGEGRLLGESLGVLTVVCWCSGEA